MTRGFFASGSLVALATLALSATSCGGNDTPPTTPTASSEPLAAAACTPAAANAAAPRLNTQRRASGLAQPWALAFLPDGRLLVTLKAGRFVVLSADGLQRTTLAFSGLQPAIRDGGQGGLMDVVLDPDFNQSQQVFFTYQEPGTDGTSGTALGRARLEGTTLTSFERLYQQTPKVAQDGVHFGSRIAFLADKTLLLTLGDRGQDSPSSPTVNHAQNLSRTLGKVVRLDRSGRAPSDNPTLTSAAGQAAVLPEIWSFGHRNPQGLAVDPTTGAVWSAEHGPQGGDEVNRVQPGANYGWPLRSYGCPYGSPVGDACRVGGGTHAPLGERRFVEPLAYWAPTSTAPSGVAVLRRSVYPASWDGQLLVGALAGRQLWRLAVGADGRLTACEPVLASTFGQRIREVRQGPDGHVWLLTDEGDVHRVLP
jgi:aldose sugar dehydrogenase